MQDPRKCASNLSALERTDHKYADWVLFDFVFGLPLFDQSLNERVCANINTRQLFHVNK
jgi:hypothetical protein